MRRRKALRRVLTEWKWRIPWVGDRLQINWTNMKDERETIVYQARSQAFHREGIAAVKAKAVNVQWI